MEINHRIRSKFQHNAEGPYIEIGGEIQRNTSHHEIELVLKDIRFIRHELANYAYLYSSQFSFEAHLDRAYWEFLHVKGPITDHDRIELEEGVLLIFYVWLNEYFENEGVPYANPKGLMEPMLKSLANYEPDNEIKIKLIELIKRAIHYMDHAEVFRKLNPSVDEKQMMDRSMEDAAWVHKNLVEEYFIKIANSFEPNRKRQADLNAWIKHNAKGK